MPTPVSGFAQSGLSRWRWTNPMTISGSMICKFFFNPRPLAAVDPSFRPTPIKDQPRVHHFQLGDGVCRAPPFFDGCDFAAVRTRPPLAFASPVTPTPRRFGKNRYYAHRTPQCDALWDAEQLARFTLLLERESFKWERPHMGYLMVHPTANFRVELNAFSAARLDHTHPALPDDIVRLIGSFVTRAIVVACQ